MNLHPLPGHKKKKKKSCTGQVQYYRRDVQGHPTIQSNLQIIFKTHRGSTSLPPLMNGSRLITEVIHSIVRRSLWLVYIHLQQRCTSVSANSSVSINRKLCCLPLYFQPLLLCNMTAACRRRSYAP